MIAVVGMGLRLPGGIESPRAFWQALQDGRDLIGPLPRGRQADFPACDQEIPVEAGYLDDVAGFDARFFGINGLEASYMDPQQRLLLETTWHAFEDALISPHGLQGHAVGVFVGAHACDYLEVCLQCQAELKAYWISGLNTAVLANRVSHLFDFRGPSMTVNTACSSGLEALYWAVQALQNGQCDMALASGVNLVLSPSTTASAMRSGILSPDARCRTFDAKANGFVRGEGAITLVLKPLEAALADSDPIYACIQNVVSRHQGRAQSLTAPNLRAQRDLIVDAYQGLQIERLAYLEAHGTATPLGDSVEVEALKEALQRLGPKLKAGAIGLGSVKTNLGHLEAAAGLVGMAKVCLAMRHGTLPAHLHFSQLHPLLDLADSPLRVQKDSQSWDVHKQSLAGVSSFGFGGSGAHAVLTSVPERVERHADLVPSPQVLMFSAESAEALHAVLNRYQSWLADESPKLNQLAETLACARAPMRQRIAFVVDSIDALRQAMARFQEGLDDACRFEGAGKIKREAQHAERDPSRIATLWVEQGARPTWAKARIRLPLYPFQRKRHWIRGQ